MSNPVYWANKFFYIQDESDGLEVYFSTGDFPDLQVGQLVRIYGRINLELGRIIVEQKGDIYPLEEKRLFGPIALGDGSREKQFGRVIFLEGIIQTRSSSYMVLEGLDLKVFFKEGVKRPPLKLGDRIRVIGILGKYRDEYRLFPRSLADWTILQVKDKEKKVQEKKLIPKAKAQEAVEGLEQREKDIYSSGSNSKVLGEIKSAQAEKPRPILYWYFAALASGIFSLGGLYYLLRTKYLN